MIQKYYEGTSKIINLSIEVGKLIGIVDATYLRKPQTNLRRENRIKTIQSSLMIEGNTLSLDQVTAIFENKRIIGPAKDIKEVQNAIEVYNKLRDFDPYSEESYLLAHKILMSGLVDNAGKYRAKGVGVFKGEQIAHMAPPAWNVSNLMSNLFTYLKESEDNQIIKSCVFHYEMEFIHPFMDGNGRMGRLWQTLILMQENPVFEYLPIEIEIKKNQEKYYEALSESDKKGLCTKFVEFMLGMIKISLSDLIEDQRKSFSDEERLQYFKEQTDLKEFTRKDYLRVFKDISTATATRDLKKGVDLGVLKKKGENRLAKYEFK
ncbi:Fic family protein [Phaeodactylibacter sp.]|uniref:Fic family protein n=1 Tax=Phaeodactylibacter sp. TaxID=1940289 RepID=UPI0025D4B4C0|nr:Fic family protein [Phaeodactylibacter sp.]MCI5090443.1 Fic family protein [Phaeodactylibacter sp.]